MSFDSWWQDHVFFSVVWLKTSRTSESLAWVSLMMCILCLGLWLMRTKCLMNVYFVVGSLADAQQMLDEAVHLFGQIGLQLNLGKLKWIATKHCDLREGDYLKIRTPLRHPTQGGYPRGGRDRGLFD